MYAEGKGAKKRLLLGGASESDVLPLWNSVKAGIQSIHHASQKSIPKEVYKARSQMIKTAKQEQRAQAKAKAEAAAKTKQKDKSSALKKKREARKSTKAKRTWTVRVQSERSGSAKAVALRKAGDTLRTALLFSMLAPHCVIVKCSCNHSSLGFRLSHVFPPLVSATSDIYATGAL